MRHRIDGEIVSINDKINLNKNKKHNIEVVVDRLIINESAHERMTESIELALKIASGYIIINVLPQKEYLFSEHLSCIDCDVSMEEIVPRVFSFNSPYGACPKCDGLGSHMEVDPNLIVPDKNKVLFKEQ